MTEVEPRLLNKIGDTQSDLDADIDNQIKELKHNFQDALTDKPDMVKYIERLHTIIRRQQKKLNKFYKKLKDHKFVKKYLTEDRESQTDVTDSSGNAWTDASCHVEEQDIAVVVKEAAENALKSTSFVYEPTSGMYYDYSTGYYYNAELRMYYDGNSGQYLVYDEDLKMYKYHVLNSCENNVTAKKQKVLPSQSKLKKRWDKHKVKKAKKTKLDDAEEGEITESSVSSYESGCTDEETPVDDVDDVDNVHETTFGCEPCMRIMVEETNVDKLKVGSLFVITCKGGTMGREGDHAVLIPDINVSKHHGKFAYNPDTSRYCITDLGSRNGTWLDGERLSAALQESESFEINHGATIQIGSTKLLCHIHVGRDTCSSCEPGLIKQSNLKAVARDAGSKGSEYREQLQNLKKKFGVDGVQTDAYSLPAGYEDRAEMRRSAVGSSHSSEKTQTASVSESIPKCNKGFKMLSKMGWSEGQTLGKSEGGLAEPVSMNCNVGKHGLGMTEVNKLVVASKSVMKKQEILRKTQNRYKRLEGEPTVAHSN